MSRKNRTVLAVATLAAVAGAGAVALEHAGWWDAGPATTPATLATAPATVELHAPVETLLARAAELERSGPAGTTAPLGLDGDGAGRVAPDGDSDDGAGRVAPDGDSDDHAGQSTSGAEDQDSHGEEARGAVGDGHDSWHHELREGHERGGDHDGHRHHHDRDEDDSTED